jgi:hypothetical protein
MRGTPSTAYARFCGLAAETTTVCTVMRKTARSGGRHEFGSPLFIRSSYDKPRPMYNRQIVDDDVYRTEFLERSIHESDQENELR